MTQENPAVLKREPSKLSTKSTASSQGQRKSACPVKISTVNQPVSPFRKPEQKPATGMADWATVSLQSCMNSIQYGEVDPFQCSCKACRNFWRKNFGDENAALLASSPANRSRATGPMFYVKHLEVKHGDRVLVWRKHRGVIKFIGPLADDLVAPDLYFGVHLDDNIESLSNGIYKDKRYFFCPPGHGAFVKYKDIIVCPPAEKVPSVSGHEMFPSHDQIVAERRQKREEDPDYDLGITERERRGQEPALVQAGQTSRKVADGRVIYDPLDVAYQDYIRYVSHPDSGPKSRAKLSDREKRNRELMKEFGGGQRAEKMIETVDKLRRAFNEGLEMRRAEEGYDA